MIIIFHIFRTFHGREKNCDLQPHAFWEKNMTRVNKISVQTVFVIDDGMTTGTRKTVSSELRKKLSLSDANEISELNRYSLKEVDIFINSVLLSFDVAMVL